MATLMLLSMTVVKFMKPLPIMSHFLFLLIADCVEDCLIIIDVFCFFR